MDILTHALTGAATGYVFGQPIVGAIAGILPDFALFFRARQASPPPAYCAAHSLLMPFVVGMVSAIFFGIEIGSAVYWAWFSHILLDIPTHSKEWAPQLFWPDKYQLFTRFEEWEWLNESWWRGLFIAALWSMLCISITLVT